MTSVSRKPRHVLRIWRATASSWLQMTRIEDFTDTSLQRVMWSRSSSRPAMYCRLETSAQAFFRVNRMVQARRCEGLEVASGLSPSPGSVFYPCLVTAACVCISSKLLTFSLELERKHIEIAINSRAGRARLRARSLFHAGSLFLPPFPPSFPPVPSSLPLAPSRLAVRPFPPAAVDREPLDWLVPRASCTGCIGLCT